MQMGFDGIVPEIPCPQCFAPVTVRSNEPPVCMACRFTFGQDLEVPETPVHAREDETMVANWVEGDSGVSGHAGSIPVPGRITVIAVLTFLSAALLGLGGMILVAVGFLAESRAESSLVLNVGLIALAYLAMGAFQAVLGVKLLEGREWARKVMVILQAFTILLALLLLVMGDFSALLYIIVSALVLLGLTSEVSKQFFALKSAEVQST